MKERKGDWEEEMEKRREGSNKGGWMRGERKESKEQM